MCTPFWLEVLAEMIRYNGRSWVGEERKQVTQLCQKTDKK